MNIRYAPHFRRKFQKLSPSVQRQFGKQIDYLLRDLRHPSLRAKIYDEPERVWQARVDRHVRFYFMIAGDTYILLDIRRHAK